MTDWFTVADEDGQERLLLAWSDAPLANLEVCGFILNTARDQVIEFGPLLGDDEDVPERFVHAQLQQAVNLWNAGRVASDGAVGDGGFVFTPRPLDRTIKSIIRPPSGKPRVR